MCELQYYTPIVEKPHHTVAFNFSKREYVATTNDCIVCSVVCHMHAKAFNELKMCARSAQDAFVIRGFETWKL